MNEIEKCFSGKRNVAFEKLKIFLNNPGFFCVLVLGKRGTGKKFAIQNALNGEFILFKPNELEFEFEFKKSKPTFDFKASNEKETVVVIENVDELTTEQQRNFFDFLSTENGMYGQENDQKIRFVFTSSKKIEELRTENNLLIGKFWDRISQLIVEFPSYQDEKDFVVKDFYSTWKKMEFEKIENFKSLAIIPKNVHFEKFLEDHADTFEGGFRDLDKIAIMYFNYRIFHYVDNKKIKEETERKVLESVKNDFFSKSQLKSDSNDAFSIFQIEEGFSMQELLLNFKIQVRNWGKNRYGTIQKTEEKLGLKPGTMKNYVDRTSQTEK